MFCAVFDEIERVLLGVNRLEEVKKLARLVEGLLLGHAEIEDDLLSLAQAHVPGEKGRYARCRQEHREIDVRLVRVYGTKTVAGARKLLRAVLAASREHFNREERRLFPRLEKAMRPETLTRLGTLWFLHNHAPANWTL